MILYPDQFAGMSRADIQEQVDEIWNRLDYGDRAPDALVDSLFDGQSEEQTKALADINFKPTEAMANAAERGLRLRKEHGRGGTEVGVARARDQCANL